MGLTVSHVLSATTPDDPAYEIKPSNWNDTHAVTFVPDDTEVIKWASAGTQSISSGTLVFGNSNGVSFGMSNGTITATVVPGAAAGIAAVQAGTQTATSGTLVFANSNGITAGMSGSSQITFSHNGITSQSVQTQNMVSVLGSTGNISFANGNGITFGANASTITASHNGITSQSAQTQNVVVPSAGTQTATSGTVVFSNNAAITFGMSNNSVITATHNGLTTAMQSQSSSVFARTGFTSTTQAGTAVSATLNTNGLSMAMPAFLTTAALSGDTTKYAGVSSGTQTTAGTNIVMTHNTAGLNLGVPAYITTAALSGDTTKFAGTGTTFNGANISGSMTMNTAGLQLSMSVAAPGGGGGAAISAGANSTNAGTVVFSNSNGVSFGMDGAGVITATVVPGAAAGIAAVAAGTQTQTSGTLVFANSNGLTFGLSGSSQLTGSYSVPASSSLVGVSGVSISTAGSTISIMANPVTYLTYQNRQLGASGSTQMTNNQIWMVPFRIAGGSVSASTIQYIQSLSGTFTSATAATHAQTMKWAIYSQDAGNSTVFNSASSGSITWQVWNSGTSSGSYAYNGATSSSAGTGILTQAAGVRMMNIPFGSTIGPGVYIMALAPSSSSAGYSALFSRYGVVVDNPMPLAMGLGFGSATATSIGYGDAGTYGTTSTAFPSVVTLSQIKQHSNLVPYFKMGAI